MNYFKVFIILLTLMLSVAYFPFLLSLIYWIMFFVILSRAKIKRIDALFLLSILVLIFGTLFIAASLIASSINPADDSGPEDIIEIIQGTSCSEDSDCKYMKCIEPINPVIMKGFYCANPNRSIDNLFCKDVEINDSIDCECLSIELSGREQMRYCSEKK